MPFRIALSGLNSASDELRVVGNNIANASTNGFKKSRAEFADIYPATNLGTATNAIGSGVKVANIAQQFTQGNVSFTDNNLDLAISGQGFFRLNDGGTYVYTRAGAFGVDDDGYVVNSSSQRLTAYQADSNGNITGALDDLQLDTSDISPSASTLLTGVANLNANADIISATFDRTDPTTYNNSTSLTAYDALGNSVVTTMYFKKSAANTWKMHTWLSYTDSAGTTTNTEVLPTGLTAGNGATLTFSSSTGALSSVSPAVGTSTSRVDLQAVSPGTGAANMSFDVELSGTTQFGSGFSVSSLTQDGYTSGRLSGINIGTTGVVQARYTNGQTRTLGQVALANFSNPQGLQQLGNTSWADTSASGAALVGAPGSASLGLVQSGALEGSNVDLTEQLVNMITAQRNFQANAQVITTADNITQTIINIR